MVKDNDEESPVHVPCDPAHDRSLHPSPHREVLDRARLRLEVARRERSVVSETALPQAAPTPLTDDVATTATLNHEV